VQYYDSNYFIVSNQRPYNNTFCYLIDTFAINLSEILTLIVVFMMLKNCVYNLFGIYYICSKIGLTENVFPLTPTLTLTLALTLKHNVFGLTK